MSIKLAQRTLVKTLVIGSLSICLGMSFSRQGVSQQEEQRLPIVVKQLTTASGSIPVELKCGDALLTSRDRLETFSCSLKNNTDKNIRAGNVSYGVTFESGGQKVTDTRFHTFDTFIHADLYDSTKSIYPGAEHVVEPPGPSFYASSIIKEVAIEIEYIEFEDGSALGPAKKGSEIIADIRAGAAKYRDWLVRKHAESGRAPEVTSHLLQQDLYLSDLKLTNHYQEQGAKTYRKRLRRVSETLGPGALNKYLGQKVSRTP